MYSQLHTDMEDGNSCVLLLTQVGRLKHELSCKEKKTGTRRWDRSCTDFLPSARQHCGACDDYLLPLQESQEWGQSHHSSNVRPRKTRVRCHSEATRKVKLALSWVLYQFEPLQAKHHLFLLTTCALDMPS